ncbi:MAG TPA: cyclic nucleotide-binding domain-containing protein [Gammaproteobacteria bacterium]|nr:cyclic nucleotide-binding domain-containing protein [Gammaproteobacteria bacterium]
MNVQHYRAQISQFIPINTLSQKHFNTLLDKAEVVHISKGKILFKEGDIDSEHYFLLEGGLRIRSKDSGDHQLNVGSAEARHPIAHYQPRKHTARATSDTFCLKIDSRSLDMMLSWDQAGSYVVEEITTHSDIRPDDWMSRLLQNPTFQRIPVENLQALFMSLVPIKFLEEDTVISQGEMGDYFYVIASGRAAVLQSTPKNPNGVKLVELLPGQFFGEEALISEQPRSATVIMQQDGTLMRLSKTDFKALVSRPLIKWVDDDEAIDLVRRKQAILFDVRAPSEYQQQHIDYSINLPLMFLKMKLPTLSPKNQYIVCCDTGGRSSAAAFIMMQHGLNVRIMKGNLDAGAFFSQSLTA